MLFYTRVPFLSLFFLFLECIKQLFQQALLIIQRLGVSQPPVLLAFQEAHPQQEGLEGGRCQVEGFPADEPEPREMTCLSLRILALTSF